MLTFNSQGLVILAVRYSGTVSGTNVIQTAITKAQEPKFKTHLAELKALYAGQH